MSAKTKIVVLHLKELIYTGIFAVLGILFIILLIIMFLPKDKETAAEAPSVETESYESGTYSTSLSLNGSNVSIEVDVAEGGIIEDLRLVNMDEAVTTMYPLIQPSFEDLAAQILELQNLEEVAYVSESRYTYSVLLNAIESALEQAKKGKQPPASESIPATTETDALLETQPLPTE